MACGSPNRSKSFLLFSEFNGKLNASALKGLTNVLLTRFYYTGNTVLIRFRRPSDIRPPIIRMDQFQLKIQKAVDCPINLGGSSSCGRVVDTLSCYCATYALRNWADTKTFCFNNQMTFLRIDNYDEDWAVYITFGSQQDLWFDASDINSETKWIWDNGGKLVLPGYTNWAPGEPNNFNYEEDCMEYVYGIFGWFDSNCGLRKGGICEAQP